ncbi:hypothetical protein GCK72_016504 [Caenorhabditis remanei]|uniref:Serpentine Receptor, class H n=1 Tax=Caenorhabditis remanei TaxID=31234 RepID=A0A6A5G632_CAERE|nr:hypothetical protein GCK72_016504 [Caenorhabditis remanei]KAF1749959.1 hypothetical protein GCK72_016504 [Caenorhabditis remanei]
MCPTEISCFATDDFYLTALHVLTAIEIPVHLFGAYIVIFKTPKKMSSIKSSMLLLHSMSAFLDFYLSFLTSPVLTIPSSAGYPLGLSKWLEVPTSIQVYLGFSFVSAVSVSIVLLFEGRYHVLIHGANTIYSWRRKLHCILLYILSFLFFSPGYLEIPDQSQGKLALLQKLPCFPQELLNRPGFFVLAVDATICLICVSIMTVFLMSQGLFYAISIAWKLSQSSPKSRTVTKMQKQLMIALGIQVTIPISVFFGPVTIFFYLIWNNMFNQAATNIAVLMVALHGVTSTITMLIVHRPYREASLDVFYFFVPKQRVDVVENSKIWVTVAGGQHVLKSVMS